jgi:hypothetical protein
MNLDIVGVAGHSEKVLEHNSVVPHPDEVTVARVVPDHGIGLDRLGIADRPLEVDDVLADRETSAEQQPEAVLPS